MHPHFIFPAARRGIPPAAGVSPAHLPVAGARASVGKPAGASARGGSKNFYKTRDHPRLLVRLIHPSCCHARVRWVLPRSRTIRGRRSRVHGHRDIRSMKTEMENSSEEINSPRIQSPPSVRSPNPKQGGWAWWDPPLYFWVLSGARGFSMDKRSYNLPLVHDRYQ